MADESHSLFQEIDEALRADRIAALWNEHRSTILGCAIAIVLGTAASVAWRNYADYRAGEATLQLVQAQALLDAGKQEEAAAAFGKIADRYSKESTLAKIKQAQALTLAGKKEEAQAVLAGGGRDKGLGGIMRLHNTSKEDTLREQAAPGKSFSASAKELLALRYIEQGKKKEAIALLSEMEKDVQAPATLRERAYQLRHVIED